MWYLFSGRLMSWIAYFVFYKLLITPDDLSLLDRTAGWFFIEHMYEEYGMTAGFFFFSNGDFRTLNKNLVIIVRNILTWSHILTLTEFTLTISILVLLTYLIFYLLKTNKVKSKKADVVILIYYTFVIYVLLLKTFVSFNMFDIYFIFNPLLIVFCVFSVLIFMCKIVIFYYKRISESKTNKNTVVKLIKVIFYVLSLLTVIFLCFSCLVNLNIASNDFLREFVIKVLFIYTYVYYYI